MVFAVTFHLKNVIWHYTSRQATQRMLTESMIADFKFDNHRNISSTLVFGYTSAEDISWAERELAGLNTALYSVDSAKATLHTKANKGHEAYVYLSYIIDHYDNLPDVVLFFHAHRTTWHNNILLENETPRTIMQLDLEQVLEDGYINTRCDLDPGCPANMWLNRPWWKLDSKWRRQEVHLTSEMWSDLYQSNEIPETIGQACCAQFAVSRDTILAHPLSHYRHYRNWLEATELSDRISGRIFEHSWQYIFLHVYENCPREVDCLYKNFGIWFDSQEDLDAYKSKWAKKEKWWFRFWQNTASLQQELDELKIEAYRRGYVKKRSKRSLQT